MTEAQMPILPVIVHVAAGAVGIISGFVAVFAKKGAPVHRAAGKVFAAAMLTMSSFAFVMAMLLGQKLNVLAGAFTFYLVATAFLVVRRAPGTTGRAEGWAAAWAAGVGLAAFALGWGVQTFGWKDADPSSGDSPGIYFAIGVLASVALLSDLHMLGRRGLSGADRTSRHLWRMCLALFVAAGSYFFGQVDTIPVFLRGPHLQIPPFTALAMLIFWMVWVRIPKQRQAQPHPA